MSWPRLEQELGQVGEVVVGELLALLHSGDVGGQKWTSSQTRHR
jgi:hypothetical protein